MEQPPGSLDDLQPQDLSTSSIATVIDLTRKGEECVLDATSLDALRMVKSPGWYPNSAAGNPGLPFSETGSSDVTLQSGDQIQPDNAFARTTVTLSYVSRSRVFPAPDSLSQRSPLYGKLSLHPPRDTDGGLGETGYALDQHYLEQVDGPVDLATQTELFQSLSQAQVGPGGDGEVCPTRKPREVNGGVVSGDGDADERARGREERGLSLDAGRGLANGQGDSCSSSGACAESSPETHDPAAGEDEVLFLMSKKADPVVAAVPDSVGARELCSLSREYISPLEDPVSPSATSQDDVEDVFVLPQASSSPSGDNSYLEMTDELAWDGSSTDGAIQPAPGISDGAVGLDSSVENKQPVHRRKAVLEPLIDLTDDVCVSDVSGNKPKTVVPHMNGNAKALQRTLKEKKLPMRSGRGTRLEAIVMNINSGRYKVSGCIRTKKKVNASQSAASDSKSASAKKNSAPSAGKKKRTSRAKAPISVKPVKQKAVTPVKRGKTNNANTDSCKASTSDSELNHSKKSQSSTPPKKPQLAGHKNSKKEPEQLRHPDPSVEIHAAKVSSPPPPPPSTPPKKSPGKAKGKAAGSKASPTAKTKGARAPRRRRKKHAQGQSSSMFSPKEPEIKLRYVNFKEEKRDSRSDGFSPFVHVERQQSSPSLCTVVNYPEEVRTPQPKRGQQAHPGGFVSAVVPSTSCLQLGRASMHSQHQRSLVCSLCGQSANAMDLGDLHGPYYPEGYQPSAKTPASASSLKGDEDDYSDSSSSSCSVRGRGAKRAIPPARRPPRPGPQLKDKGLRESQRWTGDCAGSPAAKRARTDADADADAEDWYSPPVLPLEPCEYWLHEDCGIWSAGVFLVKGKVYGLEEAVKVAQETMCSACRDPGATLGCFFKGCPNKYHYRCALESDCVLIEENFSMKCKKHKNKTFKVPPGNRWDDR